MSNASTTEPGIANAAGEVLPKDRLTGLKENWKADMVSGFILFLIALPLKACCIWLTGHQSDRIFSWRNRAWNTRVMLTP